MKRHDRNLKTEPTTSRAIAKIIAGSFNPLVDVATAMADNLVLPVRPKRSEIPYSRMPDENEPSTKYLADASNERDSTRLNPARTYKARDMSSRPR